MQTTKMARGNAVHAVKQIRGKGSAAGYVVVETICGRSDDAREAQIGREPEVTCKRCLKALDPTTEASKKRTLTASLPDGTTATRTTARHYEYIVAVDYKDGKGWGTFRWTSRIDLADKAVNDIHRRLAKKYPSLETAIIPVNK